MFRLMKEALAEKLLPIRCFQRAIGVARYFGAENLANTVPRVEKVKKDLPSGMSLPEMALRFILSNPDVSTTIPGMRRHNHVRENIAASDAGPLDAALLERLKQHRWDRKPKVWSD